MKVMLIKEADCCLNPEELEKKKALYSSLMNNLGDDVEFFEDDEQELSAKILQMYDMDIVMILPHADGELSEVLKNMARIAQKANKTGYIYEVPKGEVE